MESTADQISICDEDLRLILGWERCARAMSPKLLPGEQELLARLGREAQRRGLL